MQPTDRQITADSLGAEIRHTYGYTDWQAVPAAEYVRTLDELARTAQQGTYGYAIARWYETASDAAVKRLVSDVRRGR